jgi:tetratricopeptide (TPR) repeat protein
LAGSAGADDEAQGPRLRCLRRWAGRTGALLDVLGEGGGELLDHAGPAVSTLPPAQACLDQHRVVDEPWPEPDAERTRVEALRRALQQVAALGVAGRPADARARAAEVLEGARALGYGPVEAEALAALGLALQLAGALDDAQPAYEAAYWLAQAHEHDRVMAEAATLLVGLLANDPKRLEDARTWARHAHAVVDRMGPPAADVAIVLADHEGMLALRANDPRAAIALLEPALTHARAGLGEDDLGVGALQQHLASALVLEGRHQEALDLLLPLLPRRERVLGGNHPEIGELLGTIGRLYYRLHQAEPAILHQRRALAVQEAALGPDHWRVGTIRHDLGLALRLAGRLDEATQEQQAAVAILQRAWGSGAEHDDAVGATLSAAREELERP